MIAQSREFLLNVNWGFSSIFKNVFSGKKWPFQMFQNYMKTSNPGQGSRKNGKVQKRRQNYVVDFRVFRDYILQYSNQYNYLQLQRSWQLLEVLFQVQIIYLCCIAYACPICCTFFLNHFLPQNLSPTFFRIQSQW